MDRPRTPADHPDRTRWNERYREAGLTAFGGGPSAWLEDHRELLAEPRAGSALDIACGNGRNALLLAELGYSVDAVDISDVAVECVDSEARRRRLRIEAHRLDLEVDPFPGGDYAVVLNFNYLERSIFDDIRSSLSSGGLLIFQALLRGDADRGDIQARFELAPNELLHAFAGRDFRVLHYHEEAVSEGTTRERRPLAGLVAERR